MIITFGLTANSAHADEAPVIPSNQTWWDSHDTSFSNRPTKAPATAQQRSAAPGTAAAATPSDPRYVCDAPPSVTLQPNQFLVNFTAYGWIIIDPGSTGKSEYELRYAFGRRYVSISEQVGDTYTWSSTYKITGQTVSSATPSYATSFVSGKACYLDFMNQPWGSDLKQSSWKSTSATVNSNPTPPSGIDRRWLWALQVVMTINS